MQGLEVYDARGKKVFDTKTRTIKVIDNLVCEHNKEVVLESDLFLTETPFYIVSPPDGGRKIRIRVEGNKCYVDASGGINRNIIVGVY